MPKYLVIGGNGVIGHFVSRQLAKEGHRPVVMSRSGDTSLINDVQSDCDIVRGDVTDLSQIEDVVRSHRVSHIIHLGATLTSVTESTPPAGMRINVEGTANVLEAAKKNNVKRVVMASSKAIYGKIAGVFAHPIYTPVPENSVLEPSTIYGITKLTGELLGRWYRDNHGIEFIAVRFGSTIGPGKITRHGGSHSRYSVILENAMAGNPVEMTGGGDAVCDALFNAEVARGIIAAAQIEQPAYDAYNIATGTGFTLKDYAEAVKRRFPQADISIGSGYSTASMSCILDTSRARQDLDFVADHDLDRIIENYLGTMQRLKLSPPAHVS